MIVMIKKIDQSHARRIIDHDLSLSYVLSLQNHIRLIAGITNYRILNVNVTSRLLHQD